MTMLDAGFGRGYGESPTTLMPSMPVEAPDLNISGAAPEMALYADTCRGLGELAGDGTVVMGYDIVHYRKDVLNGIAVIVGTKAVITTSEVDESGPVKRELLLTDTEKGKLEPHVLKHVVELDTASRQAQFPRVWHRDL